MVNQTMLPTTSKNAKTEPDDYYIKIEVDTEPPKTELENPIKQENITQDENKDSEEEEDDDLSAFEIGDKIITTSKPWSTYCTHKSQEKLIKNDENIVEGETDTVTTEKSIGINTDGPEVNDNNITSDPEEKENSKTYTCRLCNAEFTSKITLYSHLQNGHKKEKKCVNCRVQYGTWRELEDHEPYCPRAFGLVHARTQNPPPRRQPPQRQPYKCSLCYRRYEKYDHLYNHQVRRCKKRYISAKWVVKI